MLSVSYYLLFCTIDHSLFIYPRLFSLLERLAYTAPLTHFPFLPLLRLDTALRRPELCISRPRPLLPSCRSSGRFNRPALAQVCSPGRTDLCKERPRKCSQIQSFTRECHSVRLVSSPSWSTTTLDAPLYHPHHSCLSPVARMRYSRLSRVRRILGHQGPAHFWPDADKIAVDSNYMALDLVINWAADDLVLCFLHAAVDLTPYDNDEHAKTGWTNWCGTTSMNEEQAQILYSRLLNNIPHSGNSSRVFQVLMNRPDRALLMSWPPDRDQAPLARDFAKLSADVQIRGDAPGASDAKTTCTRRYKASSSIQTSDGFRDVESVYIPHGKLLHGHICHTLTLAPSGSIIFACHSVGSDSRSASENTASMHQAEYDASYMTQGPQYYPQTTSYSLPPMHSTTTYSYLSHSANQNAQPTASQVNSQYSSQHSWPPAIDSSPASLPYSHWPSTAAQTGSSAYHSNSQQPRQPSYAINQSSPWGSAAFPDTDSPLPPSYRSLSPGYSYSPPESSQASSGTIEAVPPPRGSRRSSPPGSVRDHSAGSGRASGNPPAGISRCSSCKVTTSPEWRKGPSGKKDLCNACVFHISRV